MSRYPVLHFDSCEAILQHDEDSVVSYSHPNESFDHRHERKRIAGIEPERH